MANPISLGVLVTANASGMARGLSDVDRSLQSLGKQADAAAKTFSGLNGSSAAVAQASSAIATEFKLLGDTFKVGLISVEEFQAGIAGIADAAREQAASLKEAASLTDQNASAQDKFAAAAVTLQGHLDAGRISAETYGVALAKASAGIDLTPQERFATAVTGLQASLQAGAITQEQFAESASRIGQAIESSTPAAERNAAAILQLKADLDAGKISAEQYSQGLADIKSGDFKQTFQVEVLGIREGITASDELQATIAGLSGTQIEAALEVNGLDTLDQLRAEFEGINGAQVDATLSFLGVDSVEEAREKLDSLDGTSVEAFLSASGFETIEDARAELAALEDVNITATAEAFGVESIEELIAVTNALESRTVDISTETNADATRAAVEALVAAESERAKLLQEGAQLEAKYATEEDKRAAAIAKLQRLIDANVVSEQAAKAAMDDLTGATQAANDAEKERATLMAKAAAITAANLSPMERYDAATLELVGHLDAGRISQQTFDAAMQKATASFVSAEKAAQGYGAAAAAAGEGGALKFNELSGTLSILPGPLGDIAGRISGVASAAEGMGRVFGGGLTQGVGSITQSLSFLTTPLGAATAGIMAFGAAATAVASGLSNLANRVESLDNASQKLGVSFEFMQQLEESATRAGSSVGSMEAAMTKAVRAMGEAKKGGKEATEAFASLGISVKDINTLSPEEVFKKASAALLGMTDPAERTAAAMKLFGRSGADIIPTLKALGPAAEDLVRFNALLSDLDKDKIGEFDAASERLGTSFKGLGQNLLLPFTGLGAGIADGIAEFVGGVTAIVKPIGQILEPAFTNIGRVIEVFGIVVGQIGQNIGTVFEPFATVVQVLSAAFEPLNEGIVEAVRYVADLSGQFTEFVVSASGIGVIADNIGYISELLGRLAAIAGTAISQVATYVGDLIGQFVDFAAIGSTIESVAGAIGTAFGQLQETVAGIAGQIGGFIESVLKFAEDWLGIKTQVEEPIVPVLDTAEATSSAVALYDELTKATEKSAEFGQAGFQAVQAYQKALEDIAIAAEDANYSEEERKKAVEGATAAFEKSVKAMEEQKKASEEAAKAATKAADEQVKAAEKAAEADKRVADQFIDSQRTDGEKAVLKGKEALLAITNQIGEAEAAIAAAQAASDTEARNAAIQRLQILEQAQAAAQEQISFGFTTADADKAIEKVRSDLEKSVQGAVDLGPAGVDAAEAFARAIQDLESQLDLKIIDPKQFEEASKEAKKVFEERKKEAEKIQDLEVKYAEERAKISEELNRGLNSVSREPLKAADLRTSEGASQLIALATGREDPAVAEYRKQFQKLEEINKQLEKLGAQPVEIIGA